MVGQAFNLVWALPAGRKALRPRSHLGHPLPGERLQGRDNAGVQHPPPLQQETAVGDLMGEGVLERVGLVWEEPRLLEELGGLEVRHTTM